jgi:general secretion pathway protein F
MPVYSVKVKTRNGLRALELTAKSADEVRKSAERLGRIVSIRQRMRWSMAAAMTQAERHVFFTRLASMLSSRVGTSEALALLRDTFTGKIQEVSGRLLHLVESGDDLADALAQIGAPDFPEATVALVKAGAKSGETGRAIKDAAHFEYELFQVKKGAAKGLVAGIVGFLFAGVTTVLSTVYVGPKIMSSDLIQGAQARGGHVDIGWITTAGNIMGYIMGAILLVGVVAALLAGVGRKLLPVHADRFILRIPYYKDLVLARNNFIVLYGLALLVRSGVRMEEALRLSAQNAPRGALRNDLQSAYEAVKRGRPWAKAMSTLHPTDKAALLSAPDKEQTAQTLLTLADQYRDLYAQRLGSFVPALNLVSALFLSLSGGILFGEAILPILMATQGLL